MFFIQNMAIFAALLLLIAVHVRSQTLSFRRVYTPSGGRLCVLQKPSYAMSIDDILGIPTGQPGLSKCAFQCTRLAKRGECVGFNIVINGTCEFFKNPPTYCNTTARGCKYYEVCRMQALVAKSE